jgi:excisionase family DNA binding protein
MFEFRFVKMKPNTPRHLRKPRERDLPPEARMAHSINETADLLSCSPRHVRRLVAAQKLEAIKIGGEEHKTGGKVIITRASIEQLLGCAK